MSDIRLHDIILSGGLRLPLAEQGDPRGPAVLFLHGNTDSWRSFEPFLPKSLRALALTMRGRGEASKPALGYAVADFAADALGVLDALAVDRAVVCGHSFGSIVAQRLAIDHPDRVAGFVLAGAFPGMKGNPGLEAFWSSDIEGLGERMDLAFTRAFQAGCVARSPLPPIVEVAARESLKCPGRAFREALRDAMTIDLRPELSAIGQPTLLLWGDQDGFARHEDQEALRDGIPAARLVVYEGSGHSVHWEEPRRFAGDVAALARAALGQAAAA